MAQLKLKEVKTVVAPKKSVLRKRPLVLGGGLRPPNGPDWQAVGTVLRIMLEVIGGTVLLLAVLESVLY